MIRNYFLISLALMLAACTTASPSSEPPSGVTPSPTPTPTASAETTSQITVTVYQDLNRDRKRDPGEPGVADQVGLAPDTDCTIGDPALILDATTDSSSGEYTYRDLSPGLYCVMYRGEHALTTEPAFTLNLQPGQQAIVAFGLEP